MSIWGTVASAAVPIVADMIVKFSTDEYAAKIDLLEGHAKHLADHLETLEKYKSEIRDFWKDDQAAEYEIVITNQITEVRKAQHTVEDLKLTFQSMRADLTGTEKTVKTLVDVAKDVLSGMGD